MGNHQAWQVSATLFIMTTLLGGSADASPILFSVDSSNSAFGSTNSVSLSGSVLSNFDAVTQTLSFSGGSSIQISAPLSNSGIIPTQQQNISGFGNVSISGTYQSTLSNAVFNITGGSAANGGSVSGLQFSSSGSGVVSGNLDVNYSLLGIPSLTQLSFMGNLATLPTFFPSSSSGPFGLTSNNNGTDLSLPFDTPLSVSNLQFSGGGSLGSLFGPITNLLQNLLPSYLGIKVPGSIIANSPTVLPPPPPQPVPVSYVIDPARSFLSNGTQSNPFTGNISAKLLNGELSFDGGSQIRTSNSIGPRSFSGASNGLAFDVTIGSILYNQVFDIASGTAANGSMPSALDWVQADGSVIILGNASLHYSLGGIDFDLSNTPFTLTSSLDLFMRLMDTGQLVQLLQSGDMETLEIPLAFTGVDASLRGLQLEAGNFGDFADGFLNFVLPNIEQFALNEIESASYSGTLVATRGLAGQSVPEPISSALLMIGLAALAMVKMSNRKNSPKEFSMAPHYATRFCSLKL